MFAYKEQNQYILDMRQVAKNARKPSAKTMPKKKRKPSSSGKKKAHPKFGTSKLEQDFARNFLDKLKVQYQWQFEAKEIGRFYDYFLPEHRILIEIDGDFYHSNPLIYENKDLNPMQKHNKRVDDVKNRWAALHGIPLIRIWEKDIKENPKKVMEMLKSRLSLRAAEIETIKEKNKRHSNKKIEDKE